jgi:hypothetical protein
MSHLPHFNPTRRSVLQAGSIGLMGLGMNHLGFLRSLAAAETTRSQPKARNVIYIFLSGGLAQHESFDMKPDAPQEIRGEFNPIRTKTPGLHICEHLPELAKRSERWSLCRSLTHPWNEHSQGHHVMLTGRTEMPPNFDPNKPKESDWPSIAALANDLLPTRGNLPPAIILPDKIQHRTGRVLPGQFAGQLGARKEPFFIEASRYNPVNYGAYPDYLFHHARGRESGSKFTFDSPTFSLPEGLDFRRLRDRVGLLKNLNRQSAQIENTAETHQLGRYQKMAADLLLDPTVKDAFDVHSADPKLQDRYGRNAFGWSLLLARQLVEAGVRLVQVNLGNNEAWDTHQAAFPNLKNYLLPPMDRAVSTLLDDLSERGLLDDTLVVMASEFGRTSRIFKIPKAPLPGRDHWGAVQSILFAGGGVQGGRVIGSSDKKGEFPDSDPQKPEDFAATIYDALGLPPSIMWHDPEERPHFLYHGKPMTKLFG